MNLHDTNWGTYPTGLEALRGTVRNLAGHKNKQVHELAMALDQIVLHIEKEMREVKKINPQFVVDGEARDWDGEGRLKEPTPPTFALLAAEREHTNKAAVKRITERILNHIKRDGIYNLDMLAEIIEVENNLPDGYITTANTFGVVKVERYEGN